MKKEKGCKKEILFLLGIFIVVGFLGFIFSDAGFMSSPTIGANYSTSIPFNCSINSSELIALKNVSIYYNASGGVAGVLLLKNASTDGKGNYTNWTIDYSTNYSISALNYSPSSLADGLRTYNFSCRFCNSTDACWYTGSMHNVTIDHTAPSVTLLYLNNYSNALTPITVNFSVNDTSAGLLLSSVFFNISNSTGGQINLTRIANVTSNLATSNYNYSFNITGFSEGKYNLTVKANDTLNNVNTSIFSFTIDRTAPTATYTCSAESVVKGSTLTCTCTPADSLVGINASATTYSIVDTNSVGIHTLSCIYADLAGNSGSTTITYSVFSTDTGSTTSTSSGSVSTPSVEKSNVWTTITPSANALMNNFATDSSLKQIEIQVNSISNNVQINVDEYDSKPTEISVAQGNSYKYIQVSTLNLADKLDKAMMRIKVEKSWVSEQGLDKEDIALFRLDETANVWNELTTTFNSEDSTYYYYDIELTGFSFFSIAPKAVVTTTGDGTEQPSEEIDEQVTISVWIWVVAILLILGIIAVVIITSTKKRR